MPNTLIRGCISAPRAGARPAALWAPLSWRSLTHPSSGPRWTGHGGRKPQPEWRTPRFGRGGNRGVGLRGGHLIG